MVIDGIFTVKIRIGNDAMSDACDVAWALRQVADKLERQNFCSFSRDITDINGNYVGAFLYSTEEEGVD